MNPYCHGEERSDVAIQLDHHAWRSQARDDKHVRRSGLCFYFVPRPAIRSRMFPPHLRRYSRREMLTIAGKAAFASVLAGTTALAGEDKGEAKFGVVIGDAVAARAGERMLRDGGNAIDAAIASAFAAGICSPSKCGIGGYGGHAVVALASGRRVAAIDFTSSAPAAARPDMYRLDENGRVQGNANMHGWLAAGVPGTLAGLELTLARFGTRSLRHILAPAIQMCDEGVYVAPVTGVDDAARNDPRPDSERSAPLPREKQRNLALLRLLETLAARNSGESFYRGDIADTVAAAFQRHGGLVTREDLAAYRAREVEPLKLAWNGMTVLTAPLPATGLLLLEAFSILHALEWTKLPSFEQRHAKVEALRIAWADRLRTFGDPDYVRVPADTLTSESHAVVMAEKVRVAIRERRPVPLEVEPNRAGGTTHLSAADRHGNMIAITLTHGGSYGARVAVDELGVVLGHGMSRFDPRPGRPNSAGPRKRPITNMCPTIVTREGTPVLAVGAAGGTRIPNGVFEVLANYVGLGAGLERAMAAPRVNANGTLALGLERGAPAGEEAAFKAIGYEVTRTSSAYVSAVEFDPAARTARGSTRGGA